MLEEDRAAVCGPRYAHQAARQAYRAGHAPSQVVLSGRKVAIQRPRARRDGTEVPLPTARAHLPAPWQDILDLAYYSGWRKQEILGLTWEEIDMAGGVIRLSPARSKTLVGRMLPISQPIAEALARRRARRDPDQPARLPPRRHPRPPSIFYKYL